MAAYCGRGEWGFPLSVSYALGDVVTMGGLFWQCGVAGTKQQPGAGTDWALLGDPWESSLRPTALKRETFPRLGAGLANQVNTGFTSGRMYGQAISLIAGDLVTNIVWAVGTTASATITNSWFALYDSSSVLLRQSATATTAMAINTMHSRALSSPYQITKTGLYYIVFMVAASTMPSIVGIATTSTLAPIAAAPLVNVTDATHTGLTTTASNPATFTASGFHLYGGVS